MNKNKLPSDYKYLFQNHEKKIEKMDEYMGHRLRDLIAYP